MEIFKNLDLDEYLAEFNSYLARKKSLFLEGDSKTYYDWIEEITKFDISLCENISNLDDALMRISKSGILHISEIYEIQKL